MRAASKHKWLEAHGIEHWTHFYTDYGRELQKRFFDYFLKGEKNGWDKQPPVQLQVRHLDRFVERAEDEWPLARTNGRGSISIRPTARSPTNARRRSKVEADPFRRHGRRRDLSFARRSRRKPRSPARRR